MSNYPDNFGAAAHGARYGKAGFKAWLADGEKAQAERDAEINTRFGMGSTEWMINDIYGPRDQRHPMQIMLQQAIKAGRRVYVNIGTGVCEFNQGCDDIDAMVSA